MKKIKLILENVFFSIPPMLSAFMIFAVVSAGILFILKDPEIKPVKKHDVVIVNKDLPSRYGGWREQSK